jgi:hypothetical protein
VDETTHDVWSPSASLTISIGRDREPSYEFGIHVQQVTDIDEARDLSEALPRLVAIHDHLEAVRAEASRKAEQ